MSRPVAMVRLKPDQDGALWYEVVSVELQTPAGRVCPDCGGRAMPSGRGYWCGACEREYVPEAVGGPIAPSGWTPGPARYFGEVYGLMGICRQSPGSRWRTCRLGQHECEHGCVRSAADQVETRRLAESMAAGLNVAAVVDDTTEPCIACGSPSREEVASGAYSLCDACEAQAIADLAARAP